MSRSEKWKFNQDQVLVSYQLAEDLSLNEPWLIFTSWGIFNKRDEKCGTTFTKPFDWCFQLF